ncbi:MAG TPA: glycosyltransferase family 2 protein, partial [Myxococcaceae bacterium]|nr:glycosyltransferase family 2 protein [Myxococcaceae bacterium]
MADPRLTVVIPVYNEERILPSALADLTSGLDTRGLDYEVVLAENGSTDGTAALLERLTAENSRLRWFHSTTPNYGAALKQGMLEARGELVFCDEIDLCDLGFYDRALELLSDPTLDMVVGSKAARGSVDHRPLIRRLATRVHNGLLRLVLGFQGTDTHGLKAFRRDRLVPVARACVVDRDVFASEFVVRAWRDGYRVLEIPIQLEEKRQPSINLLRRVPNVLRQVAKLVWVIRVRGG